MQDPPPIAQELQPDDGLTRGRGVLVISPTYNERENAPLLIRALRQNVPEAEILIVDDHSPDGTGAAIREMREEIPGLHLLERAGKEGLGAAYVAAFRWALERPYQRVVQMDADFSHSPADVPRLLAASQAVDLAIGSRYVRGGGTTGWPLRRKILSRSANFYAKTMLRLPVRDLTGGFKCWRPEVLRSLDLNSFKAAGYVFMVETTWRAVRKGCRVKEIPIVFQERQRGVSKMGMGVAMEGLRQVLRFSMDRSR